jgi:nucleoside-diphosphate-sugar epimerase
LADALKGVDLIIHLAALVSIAECLKDERVTREINHEATVQLDKYRDRSQGIVFGSTGNVYGAVEGIYAEETPVQPLTLYGRTKIMAEKSLLDSGNVIVYRFANGFGVSPSMRNDLFLNDMVFQAVKNRHITLYHKEFQRSFIHVRDMARSLTFGVKNYDHLVGGIYNIGHESMTCSKEDVVLKIKEKVDFHLNFAETQSIPDERSYEMSFKKIREKGFETVYTIVDGIDELVKAYQMIR